MEELLHYVWKHKLFPLAPLTTTDGKSVEVVDVGLHNRHAGPDFFNAKVRIDGTLWVGNVEIHDKASDWFVHGHDRDARYDNVVLHVVDIADVVVRTSQGTTPRRLTDLIGSLCDLTSGSGDKGTPIILVQGYFNNYAD